MARIAADFAFEEYRALREEIIVHIHSLDRTVSRTVVLVGSIYLLAIATKLTVPGLGSFSVSTEAALIASLVPVAIVHIARKNFEATVAVTRELGKYLSEVEVYAYAHHDSDLPFTTPSGWETRLRNETWPDPEVHRSQFWKGFQIFTILVSATLLGGLFVNPI
ncbi:MAG: hypothetical protein AAF415_11135 [Pseudomonadota bacterium]